MRRRQEQVIVAFSGGLDSSVVLKLAVEAWGTANVLAIHIDWGPYTYCGQIKRVRAFCSDLRVGLQLLSGQERLEEILKGGPACNRCTRQAKLGLLRFSYPQALILTGANRSDSWGEHGLPFLEGIYAPLFSLTKEEITLLASSMHVRVSKIGESLGREGCKAKHLLKPLISPAYHGETTCRANEILLSFLKRRREHKELANVKIVGPLRENVAVVNVLPPFSSRVQEELRSEFQTTDLPLKKIIFADSLLFLTIVANPALFNDQHARNAVEEGILTPSFSARLRFHWLKSTNKRLLSFHVVQAQKEG